MKGLKPLRFADHWDTNEQKVSNQNIETVFTENVISSIRCEIWGAVKLSFHATAAKIIVLQLKWTTLKLMKLHTEQRLLLKLTAISLEKLLLRWLNSGNRNQDVDWNNTWQKASSRRHFNYFGMLAHLNYGLFNWLFLSPLLVFLHSFEWIDWQESFPRFKFVIFHSFNQTFLLKESIIRIQGNNMLFYIASFTGCAVLFTCITGLGWSSCLTLPYWSVRQRQVFQILILSDPIHLLLLPLCVSVMSHLLEVAQCTQRA